MKNSYLRKLVSISAAVGIIILASCESLELKNENTEQIESDELTRHVSNIAFALVQLSDWKNHWDDVLGDFKPSDFLLLNTDTIQSMEMPEKNPIGFADPLYPFQFLHPTEQGTMDIYSQKILIPENLEQSYYNPDSEVIWYRKDGMRERLLIMGPSGLFEDGTWINENEFLVFGFFQEAEGFRPMVWILDIKKQLMTQFQLRKSISAYDTESYLNKKIKF